MKSHCSFAVLALAVAALSNFGVRADVALSQAELDRLIKQLGSDKFADRDDASRELQLAGVEAFPVLKQAAAKHPDAEVRTRAGAIVEKLSAQFFGEVRVYEGHAAQVNCLAVTPDGQKMLTGSLDGTFRYWDVESGQQLRAWDEPPGAVWAVAIANDGSLGLSAVGMVLKDGQWLPGKDFAVRVWDLETGREVRKLEGHTGEVRCLTLSPDQKRVLSASWDKTARLWDLAAGKELRKLEGHADRVRHVAFSPDGKRAVTAGKDRTARVWDLESGKELVRFEGHGDDVLCAVFTPDGKRVASGGADKTLRLWDAATGKELCKLAGHTTAIWSVAVSPNGRWALSAGGHSIKGEGYYQPAGEDYAPRLWDLAMGDEVAVFKGHGNALLSVKFTRDNRRAFTASSDATVRSWKVFDKDE